MAKLYYVLASPIVSMKSPKRFELKPNNSEAIWCLLWVVRLTSSFRQGVALSVFRIFSGAIGIKCRRLHGRFHVDMIVSPAELQATHRAGAAPNQAI